MNRCRPHPEHRSGTTYARIDNNTTNKTNRQIKRNNQPLIAEIMAHDVHGLTLAFSSQLETRDERGLVIMTTKKIPLFFPVHAALPYNPSSVDPLPVGPRGKIFIFFLSPCSLYIFVCDILQRCVLMKGTVLVTVVVQYNHIRVPYKTLTLGQNPHPLVTYPHAHGIGQFLLRARNLVLLV